jgi:hypothetical protein
VKGRQNERAGGECRETEGERWGMRTRGWRGRGTDARADIRESGKRRTNFLSYFQFFSKKLVILHKKSKIFLELLLLVQYVVKNVSSDSEKVVMHFPTEAYMSHTRHCESLRDVHPYVGRVVQVSSNHVKLFLDANGCNLRCWVKFWNFLTKFAYYCKYLLI